MASLNRPDLLDSTERPSLAIGQPLVWLCRGEKHSLRAQARGLSKEIAGSYLKTPAARVALHQAPGQAARLDACWEGLPLSISFSYASEVALIGLCAGARIGVDVADVVRMPDWQSVSELYLGPVTARRLAEMDADLRDQSFAQAWAVMEARCKSSGLGLTEWSPAVERRLLSSRVRLAAADELGSGCCYAVALSPRSAEE